MMNPAKILFFDVDGTLFDSTKTIPQSAKDALAQARANGYELAIATGRGPFMIAPLLEELAIDTYVTFNGQYVVYKGEVVYTNQVDKSTLDGIVTFGASRGEHAVFLDENQMVASVAGEPKLEEALATLKFPYPLVDPVYYKNNDVYQTLVFIEQAQETLYEAKFPTVQFVRWHPYSCDILPANGSKAVGIEKLLVRLGYTMEDAVAFGDGLNDIEMLSAVGTSVAMGNGHAEAKAVATHIAPHVDEGGLATIMKELNLI